MNPILAAFVLLLIVSSVQAQPQFGEAQLFNKNWKFHLSDVEKAEKPNFDDAKWRKLNLPHDWSVEGTLSPDRASCTGYLPGGIGWYRKSFIVPDDRKGQKVFIYFEGVYNRSEIFLNGTSVGKRPNGYVAFMFDITPYLQYGKENVLAVKVDHSKERDSRWYSGSGIYRDAYLVYAPMTHIDLWGVYFKVNTNTGKKAEVSIETTMKNEQGKSAKVEVINEIIDQETGKVLASTSKTQVISAGTKRVFQQLISLSNPKTWSLEHPNLYTLRTTIKQDGKLSEQNEQALGIRTLTFDADKGFALNNQWTKLKGVCLHHDAGVLGSAVPREVWKRRLLTLKNMGCNAIRTSHNPQSTDFYELCDEIGLLVMDEAFDEWEFPKRKWLKGWNKGTPGYEGSFDFFEEWSSRDVADMVLRDRNHASIIMWSIGNEVDYPNDPYSHPILDGTTINQPMHGGYKPDAPNAERLGGIAKRLTAVVRENDTSRPVTAALAGVVMSNETEYPYALDICGYNYTEDRYAIDHAKYPNRVIYGSENGHSMESWKVVRDNEYIFAQFLWTGIDYLGESNAWPSRGFNSGFLDFGGFLKPRGHFRQALWDTKPVTYIGTYPVPRRKNYLSTDAWPVWNYNESEMIRVVGYTNAPQSKLMLNGKQMGEIKTLDDNSGVIFWDIPFEAGRLEIVGMNDSGETSCTYALQTSTRPVALAVTADVAELKKDKGLAHVVVQVLDENGVNVMLSDNEITCTIEGPAELLGLEASNNSDMGDYTDNVQRAYRGRLLAYIQATGEAGLVRIKFCSPWLKETSIELKVSE
ncbi:MAG: sugar-binding domain-containing protein [Prolixibacteraceae bacterium]